MGIGRRRSARVLVRLHGVLLGVPDIDRHNSGRDVGRSPR
jgi:hypothetical protein